MTKSVEFTHTDLSQFWEDSASSYALFPAVRHRWRFLLNSLARVELNKDSFIFDYGCGCGHLLESARDRFHLADDQLGGCDISRTGLDMAKSTIKSPWFYLGSMPEMDRLCDAMICSEVIEHTEEHADILRWCANHLKPGGLLILTTASGRRCKVDRFVGHLRHFTIAELRESLHRNSLDVTLARHWGFPFYSLQKRVSDIFFNTVRSRLIEGHIDRQRATIFGAFNYVYYLHDIIPMGPQLFLNARKKI